jgi:hypothetical protein
MNPEAYKAVFGSAPKAAVDYALLLASKLGLDAELGHIILMKRSVRDGQQYTEKWSPYVTHKGLLHIAHASGQFDGMDTEIGQDENGQYCIARVWRKDMGRPIVGRVYRVEYDTKKSTWLSHPLSMLAKTAEAFCLRRAFDVPLTAAEEMGQEQLNDGPAPDGSSDPQPEHQFNEADYPRPSATLDMLTKYWHAKSLALAMHNPCNPNQAAALRADLIAALGQDIAHYLVQQLLQAKAVKNLSLGQAFVLASWLKSPAAPAELELIKQAYHEAPIQSSASPQPPDLPSQATEAED